MRRTWRSVWGWDATAAASPTAGGSSGGPVEGGGRSASEPGFLLWSRLATNNNLSKSESDQEDNDDLNDNDWSYGAEKKGQFLKRPPLKVREPQNNQMISAVAAKKRKSDKVSTLLPPLTFKAN